jgi:glycosyltransferase involved in cell wall biosynthesis
MTTVSVVIPTYNRRTHVLRAIDSVVAQTVAVDEIIVVDDGSTDGTAEGIRSRYGSRVTLLRQENSGVSIARNRGIHEARGDWIGLLDSDDVWLPTKIERQLEALSILGSEFGVCFTDCLFDGNPDLKPTAFQEVDFEGVPRIGPLVEPAKYILSEREPFYTPSLLILRSLLRKPNDFDPSLFIREDTDVYFRLSFRTRFCFVAEQLVRIDRTLTRLDGLSELVNAPRDDRKYDSLERMYRKWLAVPGVAGTEYARAIRNILREVCYSSAECKIHQFKLGAAFREFSRLREAGDDYPSIVANLLFRKIAKLRNPLRGAGRPPIRAALQ